MNHKEHIIMTIITTTITELMIKIIKLNLQAMLSSNCGHKRIQC